MASTKARLLKHDFPVHGIEHFNLELQNSPQKIGVWWVARLKCSISLENFKILKMFFNLWAIRDVFGPAAQTMILAALWPFGLPQESGVRGVRWDRVYGTNLDQVGPNMAKLDQLGQVGRHFAAFCLLRKAPLTNLDQVGPVLFPTVFRELLKEGVRKSGCNSLILRLFALIRRLFVTCGVFTRYFFVAFRGFFVAFSWPSSV